MSHDSRTAKQAASRNKQKQAKQKECSLSSFLLPNSFYQGGYGGVVTFDEVPKSLSGIEGEIQNYSKHVIWILLNVSLQGQRKTSLTLSSDWNPSVIRDSNIAIKD